MFGHHFDKQTYENLPPAEFLLGMVLFCSGFLIDLTIAASLTALAGLVFMAVGFVTVGLRNRHRGHNFHFGQLFDFHRVQAEQGQSPRIERDLYDKHSTRGL